MNQRRTQRRRRPARKAKSTVPSYTDCANKLRADGYNTYKLIKPFLPFNAEYKCVCAVGTSTSLDTTPIIGLFNGMPQGTDSDDRVGRSIRLTSLQYNILFTKDSTVQSTYVRFLIIMDIQCNGSDPDPNELMFGGFTVQSIRNADYMKRYRILKDTTIHLTDQNHESMRNAYMRFPYNPMYQTEFKGTGATVENISSNALHIILVSDQDIATPVYQLDYKLQYLDN